MCSLFSLLLALLLANHKHFVRAEGCTIRRPHEDAVLSTSVFCFPEVFALESFSLLLNFLFPHRVWLAINNACMLLLCRSSWNLPTVQKKRIIYKFRKPPTDRQFAFLSGRFFFKDFSNESSVPEFLWKLICLVCMHNFIKSNLRKMSN